MGQEKQVNKTILHTLLEKTNWQDIYDEHYGKEEVEKELPRGKELRKHFYNDAKKSRVDNIINNP